MKHFTKQNSSLCILHGTIGIQINNIVYTSKQKHYQLSSKNPSATKNSPQSNVYYMEFFLNFSFEYSFISIVKLKFTRRNEMWCRILEIDDLSKKVRKAQDRTSLKTTLDIRESRVLAYSPPIFYTKNTRLENAKRSERTWQISNSQRGFKYLLLKKLHI